MKKLLIILMVVAMASFLFVGCTTGVAPPANGVDDGEDDEVVGPATDAPIITSITHTVVAVVVDYDLTAATNYINIADSTTIIVNGVGPVNSIIKIYVNDVWAATGSTGLLGVFNGGAGIALTAANLGTTDESKVITAKAKQSGLAESAASTAYTFTQDTAEPKIVSAVGDSPAGTITVTFDEEVDETTAETVVATWAITSGGVTVAAGDAELISAKVVELTVTGTFTAAPGFFSGTCDLVEDLAGNAIVTASTFSGIVAP